MLYSILMLDKPGGEALRAAAKDAHRVFTRQHADRMFLGGPVFAEDETTMIGSLIILECRDRAEAEAFAEAEPYRRAGLFESVVIRPFSPVIAPGKALPYTQEGVQSP